MLWGRAGAETAEYSNYAGGGTQAVGFSAYCVFRSSKGSSQQGCSYDVLVRLFDAPLPVLLKEEDKPGLG